MKGEVPTKPGHFDPECARKMQRSGWPSWLPPIRLAPIMD